MGERFTINAEILIQLLERGSADATLQAIRDINIQQTNNIVVNKEASNAARGYGVSMRRLSMDLRMLSIGLRILRNEFGGINPIVDIGISGLYQLAAAGSVLVASYGIATRATKALRAAAGGAATNMAALQVALAATAGGVLIVASAIGVLLALAIGQWVYAQTSGIADLKKEIKGLEEGLKDLQGEMRNLGVEQSALTAQGAALSARIRATKREIELTGDPTGRLAAQLKSLESTYTDVGISQGFLRAEQAMTRFETEKTTDAIEDSREAIEEANRVAIAGALGGQGFPSGAADMAYVPAVGQQQLGGEVRRGGIVGVEAGEVIMQREQVATMMASGGTGQISISISLAGANISGVQDLEGTLRRGGEAAREEIRRLELQRRRGRSRY
ncbi:MAG: hypothetical protein NWE88_03895 [Candidatus Bathyarchaeota archaeon]|nr:hypothetical protein [Candidatus Bathyarchaeota archaeon]